MPMIRECIVTTLNRRRGAYRAARADRRKRGAGSSRRSSRRPRSTISRQSLRGARTSPTTCSSSRAASPAIATGRRAPAARARPRPRRRARPCRAEGRRGRGDEQRPRFPARWCTRRATRRSRASTARKPRYRGGDPGEPPAYAAAREDRARASVISQIAVEKTAGPREHEAWRLIVEKIEDHFKHGSSEQR